MEEKTKLTATHIRYLLVLKRLNKDMGIKSIDVAKTMKITKASVSNMMNFFTQTGYIKKERGGLVYMTKYGMNIANLYDELHHKVKKKIFADAETDYTSDIAVCAFLAELSEASLSALD